MRFSWVFLLALVSCTQLPPPVLEDPQSADQEDLTVLTDRRVPVVKPPSDTRWVMAVSDEGSFLLTLEGGDAKKIFQMMPIQPLREGDSVHKRGRDFMCSLEGARSSCSWRFLPPFGTLEEIQSLDRVIPANPERRQVAFETPYLSVLGPEWGRRARIKIALGFAERLFASMSGAPQVILSFQADQQEGLRKLGDRLMCQKTRKNEQSAFEFLCEFRIHLSKGVVDKTDPE
jgi:hypothetical protein